MLAGDLLGALEQARAQADVLGCPGLLGAHRQRLPVDVHLADQGRAIQVAEQRQRQGDWPVPAGGRDRRR